MKTSPKGIALIKEFEGLRLKAYKCPGGVWSIGRYCLDEGIGIFDKNRTSNIETANKDVASSKDVKLNEAIESLSTKHAPAIK